MKRLTSWLIMALLLFQACKPSASNDNTTKDNQITPDSIALKNLLETYKGNFGTSPIYITLNYLNNGHVAGYNIHKGLRRNLRGDLKKDNNNWILTLNEPGDHPFDGKFVITFDPLFTSGKGTWTPLNDNSLKEKTFELKRNTRQEGDEIITADKRTFDFFFIEDTFGKSDFTFNSDGSCVLQLYEKLNDSTVADQMIRIRGTYERINDSTLTIAWEKNTHFKEHTNQVKIVLYHDGEIEKQLMTGVELEDMRFSTGP